MSSPSSTRGKLLREDYLRTRDWPAVPKELCDLYATGDSTTIVCSTCGCPTGGLRFDVSTNTFVHRDPQSCVPTGFSRR